MVSVFISYRRTDTPYVAGRIKEWLSRVLGGAEVYLDIESMTPGSDFKSELHAALGRATHILVVIGPGWAPERLMAPEDYVRFEIYTSLVMAKTIIPVILDGGQPPTADRLPNELRALTNAQAVWLRNDTDFRRDMHDLTTRLVGDQTAIGLHSPTAAPQGTHISNVEMLRLFGSWSVAINTPNAKFWNGTWHFAQETHATVDYYKKHRLQRAYDELGKVPKGPVLIRRAVANWANEAEEFMIWSVGSLKYSGVDYSNVLKLHMQTRSCPLKMIEYGFPTDSEVAGRIVVGRSDDHSGVISMKRLGDAPNLDVL